MNTDPHMPKDTQQSSPQSVSVKDRVFSVIANEDVTPRARYKFWCENWVVWVLWVGSIVFGALALSVLLFASTHRYYGLYEATHDNFYTFVLDAVPYVWFLVFGAMLALAVWQLRHTCRGYRQSALVLVLSSFIFSVVLGGLFQLGGFGWSLDRWLGETAPMYLSQDKREHKMWQNPAEGRLVGSQLAPMVATGTVVQFRDATGAVWRVTTVDLSQADTQYLSKGYRVRMLGISQAGANFHACGVFPWMLDKPMPMAAVNAERQEFVDRMYKHYETAESHKQASEQTTVDQQREFATTSPCAALPVVRRVEALMQ